MTDQSKLFYHYETPDQLNSSDPLMPFALTDALIEITSRHQRPGIHFWQTVPTLILGMVDTRLPHFEESIQHINHHYPHQIVVRNSGGLAVISDPGVLNMTLFYPQTDGRIPIHQGYDLMLRLIRSTFSDNIKIDTGEIKASYCPGDYDLSVNGQKFAGISQRRIKNGLAVMIYLSVSGDQNKRVRIIQDLYRLGLKGQAVKWSYPKVDPKMMANLSDLLNEPSLDSLMVKENILRNIQIVDGDIDDHFFDDYQVAHQKMRQRNQKFLHFLND